MAPFLQLSESYVVLDTETTGLPDKEGPPGIVTLGLSKVVHKTIVDSTEFKLKPYRTIKKQAVKIHGISNQQASTYSLFDEKWPLIKRWIDYQLIVIHNASFDWPIIEDHIKRYNLKAPVGFTLFCSQQSSIAFAKEKSITMSSRGPSLDSLTSFLGVESLRAGGIHGAEIDSRQTALVVEALRKLSKEK